MLNRQSFVLRGALGFLACSLVVFGTVAFAGGWLYKHLGEAGAYAVWAVQFLALSGILLARSFRMPPWPFAGIFNAAFLAYVLGWCAAYFVSPNRLGEAVATLLGPLLMAAAGLALAKVKGVFWRVFPALCLGHSAGYFAGSVLHDMLGKGVGMVFWGVAYGIGFGAGIGQALFEILRTKERLPE